MQEVSEAAEHFGASCETWMDQVGGSSNHASTFRRGRRRRQRTTERHLTSPASRYLPIASIRDHVRALLESLNFDLQLPFRSTRSTCSSLTLFWLHVQRMRGPACCSTNMASASPLAILSIGFQPCACRAFVGHLSVEAALSASLVLPDKRALTRRRVHARNGPKVFLGRY